MGILSKLFGKQEKAPEVTEDITVYTDFLDRWRENVNEVFIAGLAHHCSRKDIGFFAGAIVNEKDNKYNPKAMAVWNNQQKRIIGYVPEAVLDEYRSWCKRKTCPCVGYIFHDGEFLRGRVRAYNPDCDQKDMLNDMQEYARQVCEHFGWPTPTLEA